jgi:hypothetical protein
MTDEVPETKEGGTVEESPLDKLRTSLIKKLEAAPLDTLKRVEETLNGASPTKNPLSESFKGSSAFREKLASLKDKVPKFGGGPR